MHKFNKLNQFKSSVCNEHAFIYYVILVSMEWDPYEKSIRQRLGDVYELSEQLTGWNLHKWCLSKLLVALEQKKSVTTVRCTSWENKNHVHSIIPAVAYVRCII